MPNITGNSGNDDIDVTDDDGTLNGVSQGTPIDNIRARGGNDTISVTDSTISGTVRGNGGADEITIDGSTVDGTISGGAGGDTVSIEGSVVGNVRLGSGDDTLDFIASTSTGDVRGGAGTDSLNLPVGTIINDATFGLITVTSGGTYNLSNGTFTLPSGTVITYAGMENGTGFPCFTQDTLIDTASGPRRIQDLKVGELIHTQDHGLRPIRWIGRRLLCKAELSSNPKLRPIVISAGSLGFNLPKIDLRVSRQHRMVVRSKIAGRMFGQAEVLIPAIKLTQIPGIFTDEFAKSVEYFHLLFDQHEIVFANGAPTESLFTGPEALKALTPSLRQEILELFPEVGQLDYQPHSARPIPSGRLQKSLVRRHKKNSRCLLEASLLISEADFDKGTIKTKNRNRESPVSGRLTSST